jgi:hypothetical protein
MPPSHGVSTGWLCVPINTLVAAAVVAFAAAATVTLAAAAAVALTFLRAVIVHITAWQLEAPKVDSNVHTRLPVRCSTSPVLQQQRRQ